MVFEFEDFVVVVEVTLTESSRQEGAEGEPVRRHVADVMQSYRGRGVEKEVFGLFLAVKIDNNTAHTFKYGEWYLPDDAKMSLEIVPITLADFCHLLKCHIDSPSEVIDKLRDVLINCRRYSNNDAPQWKIKISDVLARATAS